MKPNADQILADAEKLKTDRFSLRDAKLIERAAERFNETKIEVPPAYDLTAHRHRSNIIEDEGRNIGTLVHAMPVPHIEPPTPEDQPLTTTAEQFLMAMHAEAEATYGPIWWQNTLAQIHDNIAWIYCGWRKVPYKGGPNPPAEDADYATNIEYGMQNDAFKKKAGVRAFLDYRYVPTGTTRYVGNVYDPDRFYEVKEVPERDLMETYGITKNSDGSYSKKTDEATTTPSGYPEGQAATETLVKVVEYWDREWCMIVAETSQSRWMGMRSVRQGFLLEEWKHGWGRTPYFARPAFITDQLVEDRKFAGPLDGVYIEMPEHKKLRTMGHSVAYQTAFSPLVIENAKDGDPIMDGENKMVEFLKFKPGEARQMAPGQKVVPLGQSPEIANLFMEIAASQARIEHYSLSPQAKGISPGADTANSALSNLRREMLSNIDPLAQQASRQASAMDRFALERIKESPPGERYFVFDSTTDKHLSLAPEEVISVNVTAKVTPDQGQFQLLIEKHAMEMFLAGIGTEQSMYETIGKENPEQWVAASFVDKIRRTQIMPVVAQQVVSMYGLTDALQRMMQQNAQAGDGGAGAIPGIMADAQAMQNGQQPTGMGQGSPGQPRDAGVRSPVQDVNTQEAQSLGY